MKAILCVDDSRTIRKQMTFFIKKLFPDYNVHTFESGEVALAEIENISDELVGALIDYNMEGMTGIELAEQIVDKFPAGTVSIVSANIQDAVKAKAAELGISFIEKPCTLEKIEKFLKV